MRQPIRLEEFLHGPGPQKAAVLADLDGCLVAGNTVLPGVRDLFRLCGDRIWIVSNNSTDTAAQLAGRLGCLGLEIRADRILLAGEETLRDLATAQPGARVALYAAPGLQSLATALGLKLDKQWPEVVVLARDTGFDVEALTELVGLVHRGVPLIVTNPDHSHPALDGSPMPETGALLAAVNSIIPGLAYSCLGKPAANLVQRSLRRADVLPAAAVFIGDTPETDGAAAAAAGVDFVLLHRPGKFTIGQRDCEAAE